MIDEPRFPLAKAATFLIQIKTAGYAPPDVTGDLEGKFLAPKEEVVQAITQLIENELKTGYAYLTYANTLRGLSREGIAKEFMEHAAEETEHAEFLLRRLAVLAGTTDLPDIPAPPPLTDPDEIVQTMIRIEQEGIAKWRILRSLIGEENPMRFKVEEYLTREQRHLDELWQLQPYTPDLPVSVNPLAEGKLASEKSVPDSPSSKNEDKDSLVQRREELANKLRRNLLMESLARGVSNMGYGGTLGYFTGDEAGLKHSIGTRKGTVLGASVGTLLALGEHYKKKKKLEEDLKTYAALQDAGVHHTPPSTLPQMAGPLGMAGLHATLTAISGRPEGESKNVNSPKEPNWAKRVFLTGGVGGTAERLLQARGIKLLDEYKKLPPRIKNKDSEEGGSSSKKASALFKTASDKKDVLEGIRDPSREHLEKEVTPNQAARFVAMLTNPDALGKTIGQPAREFREGEAGFTQKELINTQKTRSMVRGMMRALGRAGYGSALGAFLGNKAGHKNVGAAIGAIAGGLTAIPEYLESKKQVEEEADVVAPRAEAGTKFPLTRFRKEVPKHLIRTVGHTIPGMAGLLLMGKKDLPSIIGHSLLVGTVANNLANRDALSMLEARDLTEGRAKHYMKKLKEEQSREKTSSDQENESVRKDQEDDPERKELREKIMRNFDRRSLAERASFAGYGAALADHLTHHKYKNKENIVVRRLNPIFIEEPVNEMPSFTKARSFGSSVLGFGGGLLLGLAKHHFDKKRLEKELEDIDQGRDSGSREGFLDKYLRMSPLVHTYNAMEGAMRAHDGLHSQPEIEKIIEYIPDPNNKGRITKTEWEKTIDPRMIPHAIRSLGGLSGLAATALSSRENKLKDEYRRLVASRSAPGSVGVNVEDQPAFVGADMNKVSSFGAYLRQKMAADSPAMGSMGSTGVPASEIPMGFSPGGGLTNDQLSPAGDPSADQLPGLPDDVSPEQVDPALLEQLSVEEQGRQQQQQAAEGYYQQQAMAAQQQIQQMQAQLQQQAQQAQQLEMMLQQEQAAKQNAQQMAQQASEMANQAIGQQLQSQMQALQSRQIATNALSEQDRFKQQLRELIDPPPASAQAQNPPMAPSPEASMQQPMQGPPAQGGVPMEAPKTASFSSLFQQALTAVSDAASDQSKNRNPLVSVGAPVAVGIATALHQAHRNKGPSAQESVDKAREQLREAEKRYEEDKSYVNAMKLLAAKGALGAQEIRRDHPTASAIAMAPIGYASGRAAVGLGYSLKNLHTKYKAIKAQEATMGLPKIPADRVAPKNPV